MAQKTPVNTQFLRHHLLGISAMDTEFTNAYSACFYVIIHCTISNLTIFCEIRDYGYFAIYGIQLPDKIVEEQRIFYPRDVLASFLVYVKIFLFLLIDALMCIFCLERKFILEKGVIGVSKPIPFLIVWSTKANPKQETYKLHLWLGDEDLEYLFEDFGDELLTVTNNYRLDQKRHEIVISNLTAGNIGLILKSIRNYLREHGIIKYMLKLER